MKKEADIHKHEIENLNNILQRKERIIESQKKAKII